MNYQSASMLRAGMKEIASSLKMIAVELGNLSKALQGTKKTESSSLEEMKFEREMKKR